MREWQEFYSDMNKNVHSIKYGDMVIPKHEPELKYLEDEFKEPKRVVEVEKNRLSYSGFSFVKTSDGKEYYINCLQKV